MSVGLLGWRCEVVVMRVGGGRGAEEEEEVNQPGMVCGLR